MPPAADCSAAREDWPARTWYDEEPAPGPTARALLARLFRRSRASWPVWTGAALALGVALAAYRLHQPPSYRVTAIVRVMEGDAASTRNDLGVGALLDYMNDVVLTNARLVELMKRHPTAFRGVETNPMFELEDLRKQIEITISENRFVQESDPGDPPRSARIELAFSAADPKLTLAVAEELAELVVGSAAERQRATAARDRTAAELARTRAEALIEGHPGRDEVPRARTARQRLEAARTEAAAAGLAARAAEGQQALRFEMVDAGRLPPAPTSTHLAGGILALVLVSLLVGALLAGAFDPRLLEPSDLEALGIVTLGRFPAPGPASASRRNPSPRV